MRSSFSSFKKIKYHVERLNAKECKLLKKKSVFFICRFRLTIADLWRQQINQQLNFLISSQELKQNNRPPQKKTKNKTKQNKDTNQQKTKLKEYQILIAAIDSYGYLFVAE